MNTLMIALYSFLGLSTSGIINRPTADMISATGWITLQSPDLASNQELFDMTCEYRVTAYDHVVFTPISMSPHMLTFKPSSLGRLASVEYDAKNVFVHCKDGNMAMQQRKDDAELIQIEERCPIYMEIYLKDKFSRTISALELPTSSSVSAMSEGNQTRGLVLAEAREQEQEEDSQILKY